MSATLTANAETARKDKVYSSAHVMNGPDNIFLPTTDISVDIETEPEGRDGSGLDALHGRVTCIGYGEIAKHRYFICYDRDEAAMLRQFWRIYHSVHSAGAKLIGFNIHGFDLPFLIRRSWRHGVAVPKSVNGVRYWPDTLVDLMIAWRCGSYKDFISLDNLAKFLDVGAKNGSGEMFYRLWETDRDAAIEYLVNDVELAAKCAAKMGFTQPPIQAA
jgi:hypothetical protein